MQELIAAHRRHLEGVGKLLDSVSYRRVLARGYALVHDASGRPLRLAAEIGAGQALTLEFADGKVGAVAHGGPAADTRTQRRRARRSDDEASEPSLFE